MLQRAQNGDLNTRKSSPETPRRRTRSAINVIWLQEITSFLLAIIALVAITILLAVRKDKPLPSWPSLLNINSLVAIFSSVIKVALLFPIAEMDMVREAPTLERF